MDSVVLQPLSVRLGELSAQDSGNLSTKRRGLCHADFPNQGIIQREVPMHNAVPQRDHFAPRNLRMRRLKLLSQRVGRFSDHGQREKNRISELPILRQLARPSPRDEPGNVIGCPDDVLQVDRLTPHR